MGFIFGKEAFLKDGMNFLDFLIVFSAFLQYILGSDKNFNLAPLRVIRYYLTIY